MKYTTHPDLPEPLVAALMFDEYDPGLGQYTPSSLMRPPLMARLTKLYEDRVIKAVTDNFHLMMGSLVHKIFEVSNHMGVDISEHNGQYWVKKVIERKNPNNQNKSLRELRVYCKIGKYLIGAQFDHLWIEKGALQDYKNTTVYKFKKDHQGLMPDVKDWAYQLNIMAYILKHNPMVEKDGKLVSFKEGVGFDPPKIKKLQIVGILKDHSKVKATRESGYPPTPFPVRDIGFLSDQQVVDYVNERGDAHELAKKSRLIDIPECTPEETWAKDTKWAVMKSRTAKTSSKNCDTKEEAQDYIKTKKMKPKSGFDNAFVERRPGVRTRCEFGYCDVSKFCHYYQLHKTLPAP